MALKHEKRKLTPQGPLASALTFRPTGLPRLPLTSISNRTCKTAKLSSTPCGIGINKVSETSRQVYVHEKAMTTNLFAELMIQCL